MSKTKQIIQKIKDELAKENEWGYLAELWEDGGGSSVPYKTDGSDEIRIGRYYLATSLLSSIHTWEKELDYPELSTKDINKIVEKYGWKPMDTKDGLAWFGGKTHSCLGDHIADEHEDFENIDFLVAGWRRSDV
jgi:hypothetical protein